MILTGRTGLLALICVLPIALSPWPARAFVMLLVALAVAVTVDTLLAASTRKLRFTRSPYTSARLGQPVDASLLLCNGAAAGSAARFVTPGRPVPVRSRTPTMSTWLPGSASRCTPHCGQFGVGTSAQQ